MPAPLTYRITTAQQQLTGAELLSCLIFTASRHVAPRPPPLHRLPQSSNGSYAIFSTLLASLFLAQGTFCQATNHSTASARSHIQGMSKPNIFLVMFLFLIQKKKQKGGEHPLGKGYSSCLHQPVFLISQASSVLTPQHWQLIECLATRPLSSRHPQRDPATNTG